MQDGALLALSVRIAGLREYSANKIVLQCRDQARRAYNGVLFEVKKEIPVGCRFFRLMHVFKEWFSIKKSTASTTHVGDYGLTVFCMLNLHINAESRYLVFVSPTSYSASVTSGAR